MSSSTSFDPNTWYQIANYLQGDTSGLQSGWPAPYPYGSVFGSPFSNDNNQYYWQIVQNPQDNSGWLLRNRDSGPGIFMGVLTNYTCTGSCQYTMLGRVQPQLNDTTVFYIEATSDGKAFTFTSKTFGDSDIMDLQDNGSYLWFHDNADTDSAKWYFNELGSINDDTWSTISTTASYLMSSTAAPGSASSQSPIAVKSQSASSSVETNGALHDTSDGSGGLSTGAQAAIGAVIGGVALIAIIVGGLWYWRRKRRQQAVRPPREAGTDAPYTYSTVDGKPQEYAVEAPDETSMAPVEMDAGQMKPAELYNDYDTIGGDGEKINQARLNGRH